MSYCSEYDDASVPEPEEINASEVSQLIHLSAEQHWAFEQGLKVGKEMAEDKHHKEQIKAINGITKELHELNKTLKLIAGRLR